jgi:hypothetical protein
MATHTRRVHQGIRLPGSQPLSAGAGANLVLAPFARAGGQNGNAKGYSPSGFVGNPVGGLADIIKDQRNFFGTKNSKHAQGAAFGPSGPAAHQGGSSGTTVGGIADSNISGSKNTSSRFSNRNSRSGRFQRETRRAARSWTPSANR